MFGNRDIPVYLFTGFLESGKSTHVFRKYWKREILKTACGPYI